ncbi:MAG: glycosyltransferase family 2 protein [Acidobacteriaceae bacterium]|nr:glycosyltransferase family 2 protein [Acidobacteriaceae bacterium]MBV9976635.1 glycosyltransferase family 2 protein [Hyphomicrobiales bacterium]
MIAISLIICSHNPRPDHLGRVLEGLRKQSLHMDQWELIIVDNASRESLASTWDLSWHPSGRHLFEGELGLSAARRRGMLEANADILLFVDDDNVLAPNYLLEGLKIARDWPQLGTWGSAIIVPEFEIQPAERLTPLLHLLAIREVETARWTNFVQWEACPWGAGIFLRRSVADAYRKMSDSEGLQISDRQGTSLMSGGDAELSYVACSMGLGIGIFPELKVTHLIPKERVTGEYLLRLHEAIRVSTKLLDYKWKKDPLTARSFFSEKLLIIKNLILKRDLERQLYFSELRADKRFMTILGRISRGNSHASAS